MSLSTSRLPHIEAEVRIPIGVADLDDSGRLLSDQTLRGIRGLLDGLPAGAWLTVDLGPLRVVDELLVAILGNVQCARVFIAGPDWRIAHQTALALIDHASGLAS